MRRRRRPRKRADAAPTRGGGPGGADQAADRGQAATDYGFAVGLYREHVLPRIVDRACSSADLDDLRSAATAGLVGCVLEIGFGSGLNLRHYPGAVEAVLAVEPSALARRRAARRAVTSRLVVEHVGIDGEAIALEDASVDAALSTFTLCTIPDPARALAELRRLIRPGGRLHLLEHGLAPDPGVVAWQRRLEPLQRRLAGGCHLTRDIPALIAQAGFANLRVEQRYGPGPRPFSWLTLGTAVNPGGRQQALPGRGAGRG